MSIPDHAVSVDIDVPFSHCDPLNVVWHGRYFEYFEAARMKLLRSNGLDAADLQQLGLRVYLIDARVRYMAPLRYGDMLRCTAWFSEVRPHVRISYVIENLTLKLRSARAYTVVATTTNTGELISETPSLVIERLPDAKPD